MEHAGHVAEPEASTLRTPDGREADLFALTDYPVHAVCRICRGAILARSFMRPFEHSEPDAERDPPA